MSTTELRDIIKGILPTWEVTINEQYMLNVELDQYEHKQRFVYVEEFARSEVQYKYGRQEAYTHDVYFCELGHYDITAEEREKIREERLQDAVREVEDAIYTRFGVTQFTHDFEPRGFDAGEVLIHIRFKIGDRVC